MAGRQHWLAQLMQGEDGVEDFDALFEGDVHGKKKLLCHGAAHNRWYAIRSSSHGDRNAKRIGSSRMQAV